MTLDGGERKVRDGFVGQHFVHDYFGGEGAQPSAQNDPDFGRGSTVRLNMVNSTFDLWQHNNRVQNFVFNRELGNDQTEYQPH
jgi:hypothetical protein